jgi:hypothetical protein
VPNPPARRGPNTNRGWLVGHGNPYRMGAGHLPTKGGARGGRSPSIIVRMRSLRARTHGIGAALAFTSSRQSGARRKNWPWNIRKVSGRAIVET